jgi:hypothetical protein
MHDLTVDALHTYYVEVGSSVVLVITTARTTKSLSNLPIMPRNRWAKTNLLDSAQSALDLRTLVKSGPIALGAGSIGRCYTAWIFSVSNRCCGVSHPSVFWAVR